VRPPPPPPPPGGGGGGGGGRYVMRDSRSLLSAEARTDAVGECLGRSTLRLRSSSTAEDGEDLRGNARQHPVGDEHGDERNTSNDEVREDQTYIRP